MRLKADFFIAALIRRVFNGGGFAAVERHGADEAGAIFIRQRHRDGSVSLYGPAPQSFFSDADDGSRRFEARLTRGEAEAAEALMAREIRFDPDLWLVEIEADEIGDLLPVADSNSR